HANTLSCSWPTTRGGSIHPAPRPPRFLQAPGIPCAALSLAPHSPARAYALPSDIDHEPLVGRGTLHVPMLGLQPGAGLLLDRLQPVIRPHRIVVEEDQVFDLRGHGQLAGLRVETVPPAMFRWHI